MNAFLTRTPKWPCCKTAKCNRRPGPTSVGAIHELPAANAVVSEPDASLKSIQLERMALEQARQSLVRKDAHAALELVAQHSGNGSATLQEDWVFVRIMALFESKQLPVAEQAAVAFVKAHPQSIYRRALEPYLPDEAIQ